MIGTFKQDSHLIFLGKKYASLIENERISNFFVVLLLFSATIKRTGGKRVQVSVFSVLLFFLLCFIIGVLTSKKNSENGASGWLSLSVSRYQSPCEHETYLRFSFPMPFSCSCFLTVSLKKKNQRYFWNGFINSSLWSNLDILQIYGTPF